MAALAILDFVADAKTPLVTTVGSSAVIQPLDVEVIEIMSAAEYLTFFNTIRNLKDGGKRVTRAVNMGAYFIFAREFPARQFGTLANRPFRIKFCSNIYTAD